MSKAPLRSDRTFFAPGRTLDRRVLARSIICAWHLPQPCTVQYGARRLRFHVSPQWRPPAGVTVTLKKGEAGQPQVTGGYPIVRHVAEFLADALMAIDAEFFIGA